MSRNDFTHDRRRFLVLGGAVTGAAVLAACGSSTDDAGGAGAKDAVTTTTLGPSQRDAKVLRTASSLEELEVAIYQKALDDGVITTPGLVETVKLLQAQHKAHAAVFEGHTSRVGGEPFTKPNPALLEQLQSRIDDATDEEALLRLAFDMAQITAATHQAAVNNVDDPGLNLIFMSVAGVEARHAALIGGIVAQQVPAASFATPDKAVAAGL